MLDQFLQTPVEHNPFEMILSFLIGQRRWAAAFALVGDSYLAAVVQAALSCKQSWHGGACPAVTCGTGSLTGRLAYWALDFVALGGYDQEQGIYPLGFKQVAETKKNNK